jgi:orotidine-5'-phosphate decarboxylase
MTAEQLYGQIVSKKSFLCIGLDPEMSRLPAHIAGLHFPLYEFGTRIIDATHDLAVAYKPNVAFFECFGSSGWRQLEMIVEYIRKTCPEVMIIADGKRGDIGNSSRKYAEAFYNNLDCDALTVAPYMGADSVKPFLEHPGKWVILLALTSNQGADDFQLLRTGMVERLFETVLKKSLRWGNSSNMMYVVGATQASLLLKVREIVPDHFLLIPGVGAQGGDLDEVVKYGFNKRCGLIVNSSRAIIHADATQGFAEAARNKALEMQRHMQHILKEKSLI